ESGLDRDMFPPVCSSIDILDKKDSEDIKKDLLQKGWSIEQVDKLVNFLYSREVTMSPDIKDLDKKFNQYMSDIGIIDTSKIILCPTLARGSDYYTGIIFEVKLSGSVSGGGRYDKLIPSYRKADKIDVNVNTKLDIKPK